jgi:hypothetical protein
MAPLHEEGLVAYRADTGQQSPGSPLLAEDVAEAGVRGVEETDILEGG